MTVSTVGETVGVAGCCGSCGLGHSRGCGSGPGCASVRGLGLDPCRCVDRGHSSGRAAVAVAVDVDVAMALAVPVTIGAVAEPMDTEGSGFWGDRKGRWVGRLLTTALS